MPSAIALLERRPRKRLPPLSSRHRLGSAEPLGALGRADERGEHDADGHDDDPSERHSERRTRAAPRENEHRCDGCEGAEERPLQRVEAEDAARRVVRARAGAAQRPEIDCEPAGGGAEDVGAEADSDDAEDGPEREVRAAVHPGDLAVAGDVAGVRADEAREADREPLAVRVLERLENLVEVGDLPDEAERADDEDDRDDDRDQRALGVDPQDVVALRQVACSLPFGSAARPRARGSRPGARAEAP